MTLVHRDFIITYIRYLGYGARGMKPAPNHSLLGRRFPKTSESKRQSNNLFEALPVGVAFATGHITIAQRKTGIETQRFPMRGGCRCGQCDEGNKFVSGKKRK